VYGRGEKEEDEEEEEDGENDGDIDKFELVVVGFCCDLILLCD